MAIWYISWPFGIVHGHLVYLMTIWYISWPFGIFYGRLVNLMVIWYMYLMVIWYIFSKNLLQKSCFVRVVTFSYAVKILTCAENVLAS
jgi:hypothetical protein